MQKEARRCLVWRHAPTGVREPGVREVRRANVVTRTVSGIGPTEMAVGKGDEQDGMYFRYGDPSWESTVRPEADGNGHANGNGHAHARDRHGAGGGGGAGAAPTGSGARARRFPTVDLRGVRV